MSTLAPSRRSRVGPPSTGKASSRWRRSTSWPKDQRIARRRPRGGDERGQRRRCELADVAAVGACHDQLAVRRLAQETHLRAIGREGGAVVVLGPTNDQARGAGHRVGDEDVAVLVEGNDAVRGRPERRGDAALGAGDRHDEGHQQRATRAITPTVATGRGRSPPEGSRGPWGATFRGRPRRVAAGAGGPPEDVGEVIGAPGPATSSIAPGARARSGRGASCQPSFRTAAGVDVTSWPAAVRRMPSARCSRDFAVPSGIPRIAATSGGGTSRRSCRTTIARHSGARPARARSRRSRSMTCPLKSPIAGACSGVARPPSPVGVDGGRGRGRR